MEKGVKTVRFNDNIQIITADNISRKSPWVKYAIRRRRFEKRILSAEEAISFVFTAEHRLKVLNTTCHPQLFSAQFSMEQLLSNDVSESAVSIGGNKIIKVMANVVMNL